MSARLIGLVPAAGSGSRFGGQTPKQYATLDGRALLACTVERLLALDLAAVYVVASGDDSRCAAVLREFAGDVVVLPCGGATRAQSVRRALDAIAERHDADDWVLVHDAARPCVPIDALQRLVRALADERVGALLATPVADTLKREQLDGAHGVTRVLRTEDRAGLWQAQTPQVFRLGLLRNALARPGAEDATDEAQAIEALAASGRCGTPRLVLGSAVNIKVTYPTDLALAAAIRELQRIVA